MQARYTSKKDRAELFLAQDGKCACGTKLVKGNTIIEHNVPLAMGGLDILSNKYLNCKACANSKTYGASKATSLGSDISNIAKTKRILKKRDEIKKTGRKIQSQGFSKTHTKGFDGRVRLRT